MSGYQYPQDIIWGEGCAKGWNENLQKHTCTYDKKNTSCYQYHQDIILFYREQLKDVVILSRIFFRTKKPHRYHWDHLIWIGTTKHLCQINFQGTPQVDVPEMTWFHVPCIIPIANIGWIASNNQ